MKRSFIILLHLAYWLMYLLLEFIILMMMHGPGPKNITATGLFRGMFLSEFAGMLLLPALLGFYLFYTLLFNRFLARKKIALLILFIVVVALAGTVFSELVLYFQFPRRHGRGIIWSPGTALGMGLFIFLLSIVHGVLGLVMKGFVRWYGDIKLKEELAQKNHAMELALIKSQINPHFLFNTLNNIDMLILKDPQKASDYLNKLSGILRFMLYETRTEQVPLGEELGYIEKYLELQKIRSDNKQFIKYSIEGQPQGLRIAPTLFIPFIENAFKHTENKRLNEAIRIHFVIEKDKITFECMNRYQEKQQQRPDYGGLGNELIRKRLQLLYPGRHSLKITDADHVFTVSVVLYLL